MTITANSRKAIQASDNAILALDINFLQDPMMFTQNHSSPMPHNDMARTAMFLQQVTHTELRHDFVSSQSGFLRDTVFLLPRARLSNALPATF